MSTQSVQVVSFIAAILACAGFIVSWFAATGCNFVNVVLSFEDAASPSSVPFHFGIWYYQTWTVIASLGGSVVFQGCWPYPEHVDIDSQWKSARAFSALSLIFGAGFIFADLIFACTSGNTGGRRAFPLKVQGIGYIFTSIFVALSLLLLSSNLCRDNVMSEEFKAAFPSMDMATVGCEISTGAKCAISSSVLWFAAGVCTLYASKLEESNAKSAPGHYGGVTEPLIQTNEL